MRLDFEAVMAPGFGTWLATEGALAIWVVSALYIPVIYTMQWVMRGRDKFQLRKTMIAWNGMLSVFSLAGWWIMTRDLGRDLLLGTYWERDFTPAVRLVTMLFCLTKFLEYGDTVFLVLAKKPLIPLHVWHHLTVTLYCWHSQWVGIGFGHLFCYINLFIHGIMYGYYAAALLWRGSSIVRSIRPFITILQLVQMVIGLGITLWAGQTLDLEPAHVVNCVAAALMYFSYLYLFALFGLENYVPSAKRPRTLALGFTALVVGLYVASVAVVEHLSLRTIAMGLAIIVAVVASWRAPRASVVREAPQTPRTSATRPDLICRAPSAH